MIATVVQMHIRFANKDLSLYWCKLSVCLFSQGINRVGFREKKRCSCPLQVILDCSYFSSDCGVICFQLNFRLLRGFISLSVPARVSFLSVFLSVDKSFRIFRFALLRVQGAFVPVLLFGC